MSTPHGQGENWVFDLGGIRGQSPWTSVFMAALEVVSQISENLIIVGEHSDGSSGTPHARHQLIMGHLIQDLNEYSIQTSSHLLIIADEHALRSQLCNDLMKFQNEHPTTSIPLTRHDPLR